MSNSRSFRRSTAVLAATAAGALALVPATAIAAPITDKPTGPSTKTAPYVLPVAAGVSVQSLLTVGDSTAGYVMAGIPDGLGALAGNGTNVEVLMNHEIAAGLGAPRAHGRTGAFVSRWTVNPRSGAVTGGSDLITSVRYYNYATGAYDGAASDFSRFCSGALTTPGQLLNPATGKGYAGQIYFANEESGDSGRAFGVTLDGVATQLPRLGLFSWENTLAAPTTGDTTVVLGNEDAGSGQIRVYVGAKQSTGTPVEQAGLTNGKLHVLTVPGYATDAAFRAGAGKNVAKPATFTEVDWTKSGVDQNTEAASKGISLNRIEDGAFDPRNPNDYYFLTTEGGSTTPAPGGPPRNGGGLWRLRFADVNDPSKGATLTLLLDGTEAPLLNKPDNMAIDGQGNLLIQEDPGNNAHLARIVAYRISDGKMGVVASFDSALFVTGQPGFITQDEESSGIIDVSSLWGRPNTFLFDAQVHAPADDPALVEKGQLLTLTVSDWSAVYGS